MVSTTLSSTATNDRPSESPFKPALCGALAGVASRMGTAPLDLLKIRLQVQRYSGGHAALKYRNVSQMLRTIFKEEGMLGYWKGAGSGMVYYAGFNAVEFMVYKQALEHTHSAFLSGAIASSAAMLVTYPLDILRTRMTLSLNNNLLITVRAMVRDEGGIMAFYKGLSPAMLQVVPGMAITFGVYNELNELMGDWWAASIAAILSKTLVMPLDVLRKRHQIRLNTLTLVLDETARVERGASLWRQLRGVWRGEGMRGCFAGWTMAVAKAAPAAAITFTVYGFCSRTL